MMSAMEPLQQVLLNVWQEACRHIDIGQSTANIAAMLALHVPSEQVLVRRIDRTRSGLETVAVGFAGTRHRLGDARSDCAPAQLKTVLDWCRAGKVAHRRGKQSAMAELFGILAGRHQGDVLAGPLGDAAGNCGVLVFLAPDDCNFQPKHAEWVQLLLEPFSVALENDLRLREMTALREAAEADKRSLLTKLGRKTLDNTIVGMESGLRAVMERVELVAPSDAPVLIFGETGTGKEVIARAIHNRSSRRNGPFDRVNCGAIPPELIDSQLFGHERGAFTGAVEARRGWFERADGGTLFLDEIGELPRPPRSVCCASFKTVGWSAWGRRNRSTLTCGSSPPRTAIWPRWWPRGVSAKTYGIELQSFRWSCRRCASGARTLPGWPSISPSERPRGSGWHPSCQHRKTWLSWRRTAGRETCGSWER